MQIRDHNPSMETYRPSQECLNFFWTLSESGDNKRVEATIQLVKMIQSIEQKPEREKITTYCINRLVRGLGSGRKFARVGFSTALTVMLRLQTELKTKQVLSCFHECFKRNHKASSKAEKSALYLGNAFALTSIIQSGRIMKVDGETLGSIANDLLFLSNKRSFLKPVCCKALEDLLALVSDELFEKHLWPKLQERLMLGWEGCSLDRVCLLLVCREKFPGTVNKKFVKKHWGPSLFDEDNDEKLLAAVQISMEKSRALREKVLPSMIKSGRDTLSIWKGLGEKMFTAGKDNVISQQQLISLEILKELICLTSDTEQVSSLVLDPSVTQAMFMENHTNNPALARTLNDLMSCVCDKLKLEGGDVLSFVRQILQLEGQVEDTEGGRLRFIHTSNFAKIANLMQKSESESYIESLIEFLKGRDENKFFSESGKKRSKQLDWCVRQIQHVCCSQSLTSPDMQRAVLALFIRLAFFKVKDTTDKIVHCDFSDRLVESDRVRQLCSALLLKSLDQLSTMNERHESKVKSFAAYTDLLSYLVHYFQSMLSCNRVELLPNWSEETHDIWNQLMKIIKSLEKIIPDASSQTPDQAFRLLFLYMAFHMLTDTKTAIELLQDIFICHDKSKIKRKKAKDDDEPYWGEVLTEVLLQLLSLPSHLGRVLACNVFKLLVSHVSVESVALLTQVLLSNKAQHSEFFAETGENDEADEKENGHLLDEDLPSEESDDDDEDDDDDDKEEDGAVNGEGVEKKGEEEEIDDDDDEEEEEIDVDENLRASLKEALGNAAVNEDEEDDDEDALSDFSDSEMFKLDDALAEVFKQRKKKMGGKKAREEKRKELGNFKLRVLDLVDVLIKSERCGDFLLDLLKPLLVLMFSSSRPEEQVASNRAKTSFQMLHKRCKHIKDSVHSKEEQADLFQELIEFAQKVNDPSQLQHVASACSLMIKTSSADCLQILQNTLSNVINKKQSKPTPSFFIAMRDIDPVVFQPLSSILIDSLGDELVTQQSKALACSILTSLTNKRGNITDKSSFEADGRWMPQAAEVVCQQLEGVETGAGRGHFLKELLGLTLGLLGRTDILSSTHFASGLKEKVKQLKSKSSTDIRRLINKVMAALDRLSKATESTSGSKKKKRKFEQVQAQSPTTTSPTSPSPQPKKKKKKRNSESAAVG